MENGKEDSPPVHFRRGGKYRESAKTLLPYRKARATGHPVDNAGFFSTVFYSWLTGLVWKLYRMPVPVDSLWKVPEKDQALPNAGRFLRVWNEEKQKNGNRASVKRAILRFVRTRLAVSVVCIFFCVLCQFASNGVVVRYLLMYVESSESNLKLGLCLVAAMFSAEILRMIFFSMVFAVSMRTGARTRSGIALAVFEKVLRVPPTESSSIGEIVNVCSSDGDRIFEALYVGPLLFSGPVMFITGTIYLSILVGPIALTGCAVFIVVLFMQVGLLKLLNFLRSKAVVFTDRRVKAINEVLSSIKLIKMYAWEESFTKVIKHIRKSERSYLQQAMFLQSLNIALASLTPYVATVMTLVFTILLGHNITSSEAFTCFSMFHVMSFSLKVIPIALKNVAEAGVGANRIQAIMERQEYLDYLKTETSSPNVAIEMSNATLSYPTDGSSAKKGDEIENANHEQTENRKSEKQPVAKNGRDSTTSTNCLININLEITNRTLIGVCGRVGSGKSSLVSSLLGHLKLVDGSVALSGSTAYCAQQAWIMNATIRDNITFGLPYVKSKYDKIVKACCLLPDFDILQSGDLTEVGERGVNMSGGQKQRINIARAIYMDKDIYLLDDPLSAVDAHVGKALFENAILALLKNAGKTVVLVTHRLEYLPYCDQVILMKDGRIWEIGSHDDLLEYGEEYCRLYRLWSKEKEAEEGEENGDSEEKTGAVLNTKSSDFQQDQDERITRGRLMTIEEKAQGAINKKTYAMYIKAAGGWILSVFTLLTFVIFICCQQFTSFWLSYWLKQGSGTDSTSEKSLMNVTGPPKFINTSNGINSTLVANRTTTLAAYSSVQHGVTNRVIDNPNVYFYLSVFGYAIAATVVTMTVKSYAFMALSLQAAHKLHDMLFDKILHGTMEFFDTTPAGRILNRFQKDQDMLDTIIPLLLDLVLTFGILIISCIIFIGFVFPYFLAVLVLLVPLFLAAFIVFKGAVREMKRQDNITRSPWLSHMATTIAGVPTIRAYERTKDFVRRFYELLDINAVPFFLYVCVNRWLVTRMEFVTITIITVCSLIIVLTNGVIPPAFAGLAVTSALMMSTVFQFIVRTTVEVEANFICAERMVHYIETVPQESKSKKKTDLNRKWPEFGSVRFVNVDMRYRNGLPLVLKDVSFTINTCEKIGVVGRTGSGKSSLGVALFRLVELAGGRIEIDGVDIAQLSLPQLRSKIAIIPQEPVLFTGTVKYNVDPFGQYSDEEIWKAIERTHLKETISSLPLKLEAPVSENGGNFSVGERQLMCLTRALLRRNKILMLDEATASIDATTDRLVQDTLNEHFADCTLITIAHRLHTVTSCDRIMVLDHGVVKEFDTPDNLSNDPNSLFSKLLTSTKV